MTERRRASDSGGLALPGFGSAAVGFDTPFDMLRACHERVLRTLALQTRLIEHLRTHACDEAARSAARDVLRYFDLAAPLHHEDEELHVFPALKQHQDPQLTAVVARLTDDHAAMAQRWTAAREVLQEIERGSASALQQGSPLLQTQRAVMLAFADGYASHIRVEEEIVYPAAAACMDDCTLRAMGQEMRRRRGAVD